MGTECPRESKKRIQSSNIVRALHEWRTRSARSATVSTYKDAVEKIIKRQRQVAKLSRFAEINSHYNVNVRHTQIQRKIEKLKSEIQSYVLIAKRMEPSVTLYDTFEVSRLRPETEFTSL